jgi:hypothetical protein
MLVAVVVELTLEELSEPVAQAVEETQAPLIPAQRGQTEPQIQGAVLVVVVQLLVLEETAVLAALASSSLNTTHLYNLYSHSKARPSG